MDHRKKVIEAVSEIGKSHIGLNAYERQLETAGATWLADTAQSISAELDESSIEGYIKSKIGNFSNVNLIEQMIINNSFNSSSFNGLGIRFFLFTPHLLEFSHDLICLIPPISKFQISVVIFPIQNISV